METFHWKYLRFAWTCRPLENKRCSSSGHSHGQHSGDRDTNGISRHRHRHGQHSGHCSSGRYSGRGDGGWPETGTVNVLRYPLQSALVISQKGFMLWDQNNKQYNTFTDPQRHSFVKQVVGWAGAVKVWFVLPIKCDGDGHGHIVTNYGHPCYDDQWPVLTDIMATDHN